MSFLIASGHVEVNARTEKAHAAILGIVGAMGAVGPVAASAAAATAAAGAGLAAFGVAAGKQVVSLKKASEAQGKYQDAVAKSGRGSEDAAKAQLEYQRTLSKMPQATRQAAAAFSALKDSYSEWSDSLAADTMPVFTKSFQTFQALLPKTTGLVRGTSAELNRLITLIAGGVASPGFDRFMDKLAGWSASSLHSMITGIMNLSRSLSSFAAGGGFDDFINTAKEAGPLLGETLTNLAQAALKVATAGGDLGMAMLTAANALAKFVNALPTGVVSTMLQIYAATRLLRIGIAGVTAVTTSAAVANLGAYFTLMRTAGVGTTLRATVASMTTMQKAAVGLGVLGVAALGISKLADAARGAPPDVDRLTTSLKNLARTGEFSGELQRTFGDVDGLVAKFKELGQSAKDQEEYVKSFGNSGIGPLDALRRKAYELFDDFKDGGESLGALQDDFKSLDQAMAGMVSSGYGKQAAQDFRVMEAALKEAGYSTKEINKVFPEYKSAVASLKAENQLAAQGMGLFGQQAMATKTQLDAQKASADGLRQSIIALNDTNRSAYDAQIAFESSIDALTASFKEHGATLNLDTEAGRANGQAMSAAAKSHDEMVAAGLAAGESLGSMTGKSDQLRASMMRLATDAFDGNKKKATEYVNTLLGVPSEVKTMIRAEKAEAISGLEAVRAAIQKTPGAKSIKVDTLNAAAIKALEAVGLKTKQLPDGRTQVTTANGQALGSIGAVSSALNRLDGKTANTYTTHHVQTWYTYKGKSMSEWSAGRHATGGRVRGYASGGEVQAFPFGGLIQGPGTGTSDSILAMFGSGAMAHVSNTEFVVNARSTRKHLALLEMINADRLPRFAKGGKLSEKQKAKIEAEKQRQKEGRSALTSDVTFTTAGKLAGYKYTETIHDLGMPDSVGSLVTSINSYLSNIKKAFSGKTESALVSQMTKSGKALLDNQKKLEGVNKSLESAKGKLEDLKGKFDSLKSSVSASLVSFGNITKIGKYGTSTDTLINQLRSDTGRTTEFASMLDQLKGKGLNAQSISEIAQAGITGGGMATAQSLLNATPEQISEINALEKQLQQSADKAGTVTADAMYGAGVRAAEGLVKGLTAQQQAIEATMMSIAKGMEAAIKKALGIKSPSKLMEPIGDFAMQGVEVGWQKRLTKGRTLLTGNAAGLRLRPALMPATSGAAPAGASVVVNLAPTFNAMTLPAPAERKAFAVAMARDINDALLDYQKGRRR